MNRIMSSPAATLLVVESKCDPTSTTEKPVDSLKHTQQLQCHKHSLFHIKIVKGKDKLMPVHSYYRAGSFQQDETSRFQNSRRMRVVRLLPLRTGRLYTLRNYSWSSHLL